MAASIRSMSRLLNGGLNIISKNNSKLVQLNNVCQYNTNNTLKSTSLASYRLYSTDSHKPKEAAKHNDHHHDDHHHGVDPNDPFSGDGVYDDHHHDHDHDDTQPSEWLLENPDTNILRHDHPGYPFSKLRDESLPVFSLEVIAKHNKRDDCWLLINGKVYNVSSFVDHHPGGEIILAGAGKDCTTMFTMSGMSSDSWTVMKNYHIGYCDHVRRYDGINRSNRKGTHYLNNFEI